MPPHPKGPEDPTSGSELVLTIDQATELARLVRGGHRGSVRLRDLGAAWVEAELLDPDGNVSKSQRLAPKSAYEDHRTKLRRARELKKGRGSG